MEKRKICFLSGAFLLGIATVEYGQTVLWCILGMYGLAWAISVCHYYRQDARQAAFWILAFVAAAFCGCYDSCSQQASKEAYESQLKEKEICQVQGNIYKKEKENETYLYYLKNCSMQLHQKKYQCNQVLVNLTDQEYFIGETLCIKGTIKPFSIPVNEGNYNEKAYYQSLNIDFKLEGTEVMFASGKKNAIQEGFYRLKEKMKESYQTAMPEADAGVLTAMTMGDKSLMDAERKKLYQNAGISHFYSISGLHISMIGMALYQLMRKRGLSYMCAGAAAALLIVSYGEMIGFGISASRAIGMFLLSIYAKYRGRTYDRATALALMAAILAGENPGLLHHAGYLLSFGAVVGVLFAERITGAKYGEPEEAEQKGKKPKKLEKRIKTLKETLLVSSCIQLATIPIMCQFFYEISVYAVCINLIVLPCMGVLLGMGLLGGGIGCFFPWAGKLLLYPCYLILLLFHAVCELFLQLPNASFITGKLPVWLLLLWYGCMALAFAAPVYWKKRLLFGVVLPVCCLFLLTGPKEFELDFLDVGQGDGIFLSAGDGTAVFIDGGSSSVSKVGEYRILPFLKYRCIRKIDYWFISHCDADHISGLMEVMEAGYPIANLVVSEYMPNDEAWQEVRELAEKKKIPILTMGSQDSIQSREFRIRCLSLKQKGSVADRNEASLALLYETEAFRGFFAGDIGEEEEKRLLQQWELEKVDVYKASHHGSNTSNCSEFLAAIRPDITIISCGLRNRYGHPGEAAMLRLRETDARIYETRYLGQIKITGTRLEAKVQSMLKSTYEKDR